MSNYRPPSLLPSFSEIFEKVIHLRLYQHCIENILSNRQYCFRCNSSTEIATFNLLNEIYCALNERKIVGGIFCDLKKAFDCIGNCILSSKLEFCGIRGNFLRLIKTYLEDRSQKVLINSNNRLNILSTECKRVSCGVPQCCILGPLLFLIYINDLPFILEGYSFPVIFADNMSVVITETNSIDFLMNSKEIFSQLIKWFSANQLSLNYDKTNFLHFRTKNSSILDTK
jgi:hypothetical protein